MANQPPPNHVADLPEDDPEEQPELAPEPDYLNEFALHQIPQPEGNMNGWILKDDEEEEEEEDPEMEEEIEEENDDDDAECFSPNDQEQSSGYTLEPSTRGTITLAPIFGYRFVGRRHLLGRIFAPGPTGRDVNTLHRQVKGLTQQMFYRANTEHSTLKRLSVMDKYLAEFDTDLRGEIKSQHWSFEVQWHLHPFIHYRERPYVAPTALVAHVDRTDPDDPSPRPTCRPRHDDPYVIVRDAATRNEGMILLLLGGWKQLAQDCAKEETTNGAGRPVGIIVEVTVEVSIGSRKQKVFQQSGMCRGNKVKFIAAHFWASPDMVELFRLPPLGLEVDNAKLLFLMRLLNDSYPKGSRLQAKLKELLGSTRESGRATTIRVATTTIMGATTQQLEKLPEQQPPQPEQQSKI
ncbi:hypothetical protein Tco_0726606 [Tanacetum coccineum]|uniref:Uncharacterized protein n=1 Tax=Tanacetum coccineum TaxID=301880 RepID=A0ABQ4YGQ9_9ASTR